MTATAVRKPQQTQQFQMPPLPFAEDALAPVISAETLRFHHGKHHKKYVDTMNQLLQENGAQGSTLEEVVRSSSGKLFNNAAQAWNHDFYWKSLSAAPTRPEGSLLAQIDRDCGGYEALTRKLAEAAS